MRVGRLRQRYPLALGLALALAVAPCWGCERRAEGRDPGAVAEPTARGTAAETPVVLFLGDSLTAGYGLPAEEAFPALVQERIDAAGLDYRVVNAGVSGDTSAGGRRRIAWLLRQPVAVLVLGLGANDMLRGQSVEALHENLRAIVDATRDAHPEARVLIAGMRAAPNLGREYGARFEETYRALAEETGAELMPFVLEGVAAVPELNQPDGIHPNAEGHKVVAKTLWQALEPLLAER